MRLTTRADYAKLAGVSKMAVTKACRSALAAATVGPRIDLDHPDALAYLQKKGIDPTAIPDATGIAPPAPTAARPQKGATEPKEDSPHDYGSGPTEDLKALRDHLRPIVDRFGSATAAKDWLDVLKRVEDLVERRIRNAESERGFIPRDAVQTLVMASMDAANRRLLTDASRTIARRVYSMARAGNAIEEAERDVRDVISSILRPAKETVARVLR